NYSRPSILRTLRERGIAVAAFLPSPVPFAHPYFNMRNHRKLLIVDGRIGFTGGLNIRDGCVLVDRPLHATRDLHFRLTGPVVGHLSEAFAFDWRFTTGEVLRGDRWFPPLEATGGVIARGIPDGPDETQDAYLMTLLGALAEARDRVVIVTPYFLPDAGLLEALRVTVLRGVQVRLLTPARGNLRLVQWAQQAVLSRALARGVRVELTPEPFDHSKLLVVDGAWALIGSANWDPRSLRLNFEFQVECYSAELAGMLEKLVEAKAAGARVLGRHELDRRGLWPRLRDGAAWLLQPYL
ncbi:MAG: cardiolipin synthase, partial [Gemmatimonadetes bacterium]|nr:cardiolipin synthase [Gemmatimonadota bacterium]